MVGWVICTEWTHPTTHVTPGEPGSQKGSKKPEAGGVDPPLAAATLNGGLPNLMGEDGAWIFGVCWMNRGRAGVRMNIATDK